MSKRIGKYKISKKESELSILDGGTIKGNFSGLITVSNKIADLYSSSELNKQLKKYEIISYTDDNIYNAWEKSKHRKDFSVPVLIFGSHYIARDVFDLFDFSFDSGII